MSEEFKRSPEEGERLSRLSANVPKSQPENDDAVVREYEARYQEPRRMRSKPRSYSTLNVTDEERMWATIAHGSIWVTVLGGLLTSGFVVPLSVFVPLVIYFMFRKKSDYIVFHSLQAFVLQLIATVGALALAIFGGAIWILGLIIALLAVFVLAGVIIVPLWVIIGVVLVVAVFVTPIAALLLGTIATVETYNKRDYRYPFIARWIDRQLAGEFLNTA